MWRVVAAELRQWAKVQAGTFLIGLTFLAVAFVIEAENAAASGQNLDVREARVLFVWLFFCAAPLLIGWYWNLSWNQSSTFRVVDTLPFSKARLNLVRLLSLLIQITPVLIVWYLHYQMLDYFDRAITPWLVVGLLFFLLFWAAGALCHKLFWAGMWATIVLTVLINIPDRWETQLSLPTTISAVWTAIVFAVLTAGLSWWTINRQAPRRTGKWGITRKCTTTRKVHGSVASLCVFLALLTTTSLSPSRAHCAGEYVYQAPESLDDGWTVSSLRAEGMKTDIITRLTNHVIDGKFKGIHSILIVKNGVIVYEEYFGDYRRESLQTIYSITKSVTSGLIGIAIDKGFIGGVDETVAELLPEYADAIKDDRFRDVTLEHILTLTSGLEWDEKSYPYNDPGNSEYHQVRSDDWVRYVVERPMRDEPGARYIYNTGSVHLLSAIIKSNTGLYADQFAEKYLFEPLGIKRYQWNTDPKGHQCTGGTHGGLRLTTRDVSKFGMLYLRNGKWNGRPVISEDWVRKSTARRVTAFHNTGFGYLWWLASLTIKNTQIKMIYGAGYGGQSLTLVPQLDLMFVMTCWGRADDADIFGPMLMIINSALTE
jgi:CubicO group peptidase (beta-lactamase class C family)